MSNLPMNDFYTDGETYVNCWYEANYKITDPRSFLRGCTGLLMGYTRDGDAILSVNLSVPFGLSVLEFDSGFLERLPDRSWNDLVKHPASWDREHGHWS